MGTGTTAPEGEADKFEARKGTRIEDEPNGGRENFT